MFLTFYYIVAVMMLALQTYTAIASLRYEENSHVSPIIVIIIVLTSSVFWPLTMIINTILIPFWIKRTLKELAGE